MATQPALYLRNRAAWRTWLKRHHDSSPGVWLRFYKQRVGKKSLAYAEAVEEALCFGWIDGQLRRLDAEKHIIRFTPRRPDSVWAPSNIKRVRQLIRQKKMTPAGLKIFRASRLEKQTAPTVRTVMKKSKRIIIPSDLQKALSAKPIALQHFLGYPPSFRLLAIHWVKGAKKEETRQRRISNVVANAAKHRRPRY